MKKVMKDIIKCDMMKILRDNFSSAKSIASYGSYEAWQIKTNQSLPNWLVYLIKINKSVNYYYPGYSRFTQLSTVPLELTKQVENEFDSVQQFGYVIDFTSVNKSKIFNRAEKYNKKIKHYNSFKIKNYVDYDYIEKLNKDDLEFLSKFNNEYYCGIFKKTRLETKYVRPLHKKVAQRRSVYRDNNSRAADLFSFLYNELVSISSGMNYDKQTDIIYNPKLFRKSK